MRPSERLLLEHPDCFAPFAVEASVLTAHLTALSGVPYELLPVTPEFFVTLSESDFQALSTIANEPLIRTYFWTHDQSAGDIQKYLSFFQTSWRLKRFAACGAICNSSGQIRGLISLEAAEGTIGLMYWISDRDRGVMSLVLQHILSAAPGDTSFSAKVHRENTRSQNLLGRLGFQPDDNPTLREYTFWIRPCRQPDPSQISSLPS